MRGWKKVLLGAACLISAASVAYASVGLKEAGVDRGPAMDINFVGAPITGLSTKTVDLSAPNADVDITGALTTTGAATIGGLLTGATVTSTGAFIASTTSTFTGVATFSAGASFGWEAVTTSAADPGLGVANIIDLVTAVTTDETGTAADQITLADGAVGQLKVIHLVADTETAGLAIIPANFGPGTQILLEDADDVVLIYFDGTNWEVIVNTGGTIS